jgi:hypothetical protein
MQSQYTRSWAGAEAPAPGSVRPRFYLEPVQDELASAREGRPIFREVERVEIFLPGNPWTMPVHNVTDEHRQRWSREYEAFRQGLEPIVDGTPIAEWPILNRAQVMELQALQIMSVEEVAALSDTACQRAMGLMALRSKARAYLDDAQAVALTEQLSKENENLRSEQASLKRQVEELGELVNRLHGELMGMKNAPNPIAAAIPGMADPMQAAAMQAVGILPRDEPRSSLAAFSDEQVAVRRRPGRPRKEEEAA